LAARLYKWKWRNGAPLPEIESPLEKQMDMDQGKTASLPPENAKGPERASDKQKDGMGCSVGALYNLIQLLL